MNEEQFTEWYKDFIKKHGGKSLKEPSKWFNKVQTSHKNLIELLGGEEVTVDVELVSGTIFQNDIEPILNNIKYYLPDYLKTYELTVDDFLTSKIKKCKDITVTKHIKGYAERIKAPECTMKQIEYYLTKMGTIYSGVSKTNEKYTVNLSCSAKKFAEIGNFGCDEGSCFRQGGGLNSHLKYIVGVNPDTFAITVHDKDKCKFRMLGFIKNGNHCAISPYPYYQGQNTLNLSAGTSLCSNAMLKIFGNNLSRNSKCDASWTGHDVYGHNPSVVLNKEPELGKTIEYVMKENYIV